MKIMSMHLQQTALGPHTTRSTFGANVSSSTTTTTANWLDQLHMDPLCGVPVPARLRARLGNHERFGLAGGAR